MKKSENEFVECFKKLKIEKFKNSIIEQKSSKISDQTLLGKHQKAVESNIEQILSDLFKDAYLEPSQELAQTLEGFYNDSGQNYKSL